MLIAELTVVPVTMKLLTESREVPSCVMTVARPSCQFLVPSLRLRLAAQASGGPAGRTAQTAVGLQSQSETPSRPGQVAACRRVTVTGGSLYVSLLHDSDAAMQTQLLKPISRGI